MRGPRGRLIPRRPARTGVLREKEAREKDPNMREGLKALPAGRAFFMCVIIWGWCGAQPPVLLGAEGNSVMTEAEAVRLGEEFGVVVGSMTEDIKNELKFTRSEGVVVFEVIGGTRAELAGIKVRAVIKEIDKVEVKNLIDFGKALQRALKQCDFTLGTYEPADPGDPVGWGVNFHFVGCRRD